MTSRGRASGPCGLARCLVWAALGLVASGVTAAERPAARYSYTPKHREATVLLRSVVPFLSPGGTISLHASGQTLVVLDDPATIAKLVPLLRDLDHPELALSLRFRVLRASSPGVSGDPTGGLSPEMTSRLTELLPHRRYELLSESSLETREGARVEARLEPALRMSFAVGPILAKRRLRLEGFHLSQDVSRRPDRPSPGAVELVRGDVNLWIDRPVAIAITESSGSGTLVIVVEGRVIARAEPPAQAPSLGGDPSRPRPTTAPRDRRP